MVRVRFCVSPKGHRIAFVDEGAGPLLVFPPRWVSHLELEAQEPAYVRFFSELAKGFRVVRYDRPGTGLSDRGHRAARGSPRDRRAGARELGAWR
jgi:pimeloyl-ACP methyl ester carboxylesterase